MLARPICYFRTTGAGLLSTVITTDIFLKNKKQQSFPRTKSYDITTLDSPELPIFTPQHFNFSLSFNYHTTTGSSTTINHSQVCSHSHTYTHNVCKPNQLAREHLTPAPSWKSKMEMTLLLGNCSPWPSSF